MNLNMETAAAMLGQSTMFLQPFVLDGTKT